ncbi:MAG: adenylate/guanylate cyclase domain-containing protein [Flavobacteriaceae bacterium]|nr:adenylate/guanylate cyclase domain-containing protein [Flavobacteriaceae bacterium]
MILKFTTLKAYLIMGFFCFPFLLLYGQNQKLSDSLELVYKSKAFNSQDELKILKEISESQTDTEKKLIFSLKLIETAKKLDSSTYLFSGYLQSGNTFRLKSDLTKALESYFKAAKIAVDGELKREQGSVNIAIADVYSIMGDHNNAVSYYHKGIKILKIENDSINIASAHSNLGDEYFNQNKLDSALFYFSESGKVFKILRHDLGMAYNLGNVGLVYAKKGENEKAESNLNLAIDVLTKLGDHYPICVYLNAMSDIYSEKGAEEKAISYASRSLILAQKYGLKDQISDANFKLYQIYDKEGNISESFKYFKNYVIYKDSVSSIKAVQQMANVRTAFDVSQKQIEVDLLNQQKRTQKIIVIFIVIALFLIALLALGLFKRNKFIQKTSKIIAYEKNRSDNLLLNILPEETALELKENGTVQAKKFESVTVLFTDFVGFTKYSEHLTPEELVKSIDFYFSKFDEIIKKYDLEKIKTIGDSYMCAGGLPFPTSNHAIKMVQAAFEMIEFVADSKSNGINNLPKFEIRLGINTGPIIAGVVGTRKFSYDIWGDTVNVASRMESSSEIGKINISENTYNLIKEAYNCTYRGDIKVKNRGYLKMYYVNKIK